MRGAGLGSYAAQRAEARVWRLQYQDAVVDYGGLDRVAARRGDEVALVGPSAKADQPAVNPPVVGLVCPLA